MYFADEGVLSAATFLPAKSDIKKTSDQSDQELSEKKTEIRATLAATISRERRSDYSLRDCVIHNNASQAYVSNDMNCFKLINPCYKELLTSNHKTVIKGYSRMQV